MMHQSRSSKIFIAKHPISKGLIELARRGILSQWRKDPSVFFIVGLDKVALVTINGNICIERGFRPSQEQRQRCCEVIKMAKALDIDIGATP